MAASCSPSPHTNLFGVQTAYGPVHPMDPWTRAGRVAGTALGVVVGTASFVRGLLRKR